MSQPNLQLKPWLLTQSVADAGSLLNLIVWKFDLGRKEGEKLDVRSTIIGLKSFFLII